MKIYNRTEQQGKMVIYRYRKTTAAPPGHKVSPSLSWDTHTVRQTTLHTCTVWVSLELSVDLACLLWV